MAGSVPVAAPRRQRHRGAGTQPAPGCAVYTAKGLVSAMDERRAASGDNEDGLAGRQGPALYPIGRALRATFDADNHDTLGDDLTALMLRLARVEPPEGAPPPVVEPAPIAAARPALATVSRLRRLAELLWPRVQA